ncbi:hypothetical protein FOMPIDRAFT_1045562 [Fomitopsis schrenkii]|uniref:Uncharacterized protein n=1 Tax=Fomitopsis schrenkii TaxID=2126942 RepID=S8EPD8_FOMSC|nr:hypothetical protein FOMPIDRAFT_1045562 [Fomitopsis schrenkii]
MALDEGAGEYFQETRSNIWNYVCSRIDAGPQALSSKSGNDSSFIQIFKLKPKGAVLAPAQEGGNPPSTSGQLSAPIAQREAPAEDEDIGEGAAGGDGDKEAAGGVAGCWQDEAGKTLAVYWAYHKKNNKAADNKPQVGH